MARGTLRLFVRPGLLLALATVMSMILTSDTAAQKRPGVARKPHRSGTASPGPAANGHVTIVYPDSVDLAAFVDYVSQSLDLKIIYGDEVKNQSVVFRPGEMEVPQSQLLDLLRSMLRMCDLALIDADIEGWSRIVRAGDLQRHVAEIRREAVGTTDTPSNRVVSQVVSIAASNFSQVVNLVRNFLSSPKASIIEIPDKQCIIITDFESAIARAMEIVKLVDRAPATAQIVSVPLNHGRPESVAERVTQLLGEKAKIEDRAAPPVAVRADPDAGAILLIGAEEEIREAKELIARVDVPRPPREPTVTYSPHYITVERLGRLIDGVVTKDAAARDDTQIYLDQEANRLYVTAPSSVQAQISQLLDHEDVPTAEASRPLRIYRPQNRVARDLIGTLAELLPVVSIAPPADGEPSDPSAKPHVPAGPNRPPNPRGIGQPPPMPPAQEPIPTPSARATSPSRLRGDDFVVSLDEHTNAIIALGTREFHAKLSALLNELDRRRPQVLIEMTLVAITFNDSLSLAVELANQETIHGYQSLIFSGFGLSDVEVPTGTRGFHPGGGLNGVVMGPNETPFLMRAIAAHGNSKIITTPKAIVSDNTTASIASVEEAPFTSINASDTVATTSFAGFESAGTTLSATPHIAQGDHLILDYSLNFSNFTGGGSVGVPPPRTTNTFSGSVEIPDRHTIVVGGLVTENETDSVTEVPLLGRIPVLGALFQSSDRARTKSRIYAFIRVTILRDDQFADLKMISTSEVERAQLANTDYPPSEYEWMR